MNNYELENINFYLAEPFVPNAGEWSKYASAKAIAQREISDEFTYRNPVSLEKALVVYMSNLSKKQEKLPLDWTLKNGTIVDRRISGGYKLELLVYSLSNDLSKEESKYQLIKLSQKNNPAKHVYIFVPFFDLSALFPSEIKNKDADRMIKDLDIKKKATEEDNNPMARLNFERYFSSVLLNLIPILFNDKYDIQIKKTIVARLLNNFDNQDFDFADKSMGELIDEILMINKLTRDWKEIGNAEFLKSLVISFSIYNNFDSSSSSLTLKQKTENAFSLYIGANSLERSQLIFDSLIELYNHLSKFIFEKEKMFSILYPMFFSLFINDPRVLLDLDDYINFIPDFVFINLLGSNKDKAAFMSAIDRKLPAKDKLKLYDLIEERKRSFGIR